MNNNLRFIEIARSELPSIEIAAGQILYCHDDNTVFYDASDDFRTMCSSIKIIDSSRNLSEYTNSDPHTVCVAKDPSLPTFWLLNKPIASEAGTYDPVYTNEEVRDYLFPSYNMVRVTLNSNGKNIAPLTVASQVYTSAGETVESKLRNIGVITSSFINIVVKEEGSEFVIPTPYVNYFDRPGIMDVFIGTTIIYPNRYSISKNSNGDDVIKFTEPVKANRSINFRFIYNTRNINETTAINNLDGSLINRNSIPTNRLASTTQTYTSTDNETVATAAAVRNLYNTLSSMCNEKNIFVTCSTTVDGNKQKLDLPVEYELLNGNTLQVQFTSPVTEDTVIVHQGKEYKIYEDNDTVLPSGHILANDRAFLQFDEPNHRFNITNGMLYKIDEFSQFIIASEPTDRFSFSDLAYVPGMDVMSVYMNGLKLIKGLNYNLDEFGKSIRLINFEADVGDTIEMISHRVAKVNRTVFKKNDPASLVTGDTFIEAHAIRTDSTGPYRLRLVLPAYMSNGLRVGDKLLIRFISQCPYGTKLYVKEEGSRGDYSVCNMQGEVLVPTIEQESVIPVFVDRNKKLILLFSIDETLSYIPDDGELLPPPDLSGPGIPPHHTRPLYLKRDIGAKNIQMTIGEFLELLDQLQDIECKKYVAGENVLEWVKKYQLNIIADNFYWHQLDLNGNLDPAFGLHDENGKLRKRYEILKDFYARYPDIQDKLNVR